MCPSGPTLEIKAIARALPHRFRRPSVQTLESSRSVSLEFWNTKWNTWVLARRPCLPMADPCLLRRFMNSTIEVKVRCRVAVSSFLMASAGKLPNPCTKCSSGKKYLRLLHHSLRPAHRTLHGLRPDQIRIWNRMQLVGMTKAHTYSRSLIRTRSLLTSVPSSRT